MPWARPTLTELRDQAFADFQARLPEAQLLRRSNVGVTADVLAGLAHSHYGFLVWVQAQLFPDSAETDFLDRWARIWGVARKPAARGAGVLTATGSDGAAIPQGIVLARADGARVETTQAAAIAGGAAAVPVRALAAGAAGDAPPGVEYRLETALAGIDAAWTVADAGDGTGLAGGADAEADAALRARLLARIQAPPHGGAGFDYERWALEVAGVTRAWVRPGWLGLGTVGVGIAADADPAGPIPPAAQVAAVAAHLEPLRPVTAEVHVFAPAPRAVDVTIEGLDPDTPAVRQAVDLELADLFRREGALGAGLPVSKIWEAVSLAAGERRHVIAAPAADVAPAAHELPILGTVSYVAA